MQKGYYRLPTIAGDSIVFTSEDDLWRVSKEGGIPRRLTVSPAANSTSALSPNGAYLAFTGQAEGHREVYIMDAEGGPARRLTYLGSDSHVIGWTPDSSSILFGSIAGEPFYHNHFIYSVQPEGGEPTRLPFGVASHASLSGTGEVVICRHAFDLTRWKRYRGGAAGVLWIRDEGETWRKMPLPDGNVVAPWWLLGRIYFISDHEGIGNIYSCLPSGDDLRQETFHDTYYARNSYSDGRSLIYQCGGDLFVFDPKERRSREVEIEFRAPRPHTRRKFVEAGRHLDGIDASGEGESIVVASRGALLAGRCWEGAILPLGEASVRHRFPTWLPDGKRVVAVTDNSGEIALSVFDVSTSALVKVLGAGKIGRPLLTRGNPATDTVALVNHRDELLIVDIEAETVTLVETSRYGSIYSLDWSPCGRWLAYSLPITQFTSVIKLYDISSGVAYPVTPPGAQDSAPSFDPDGRYLYFLSSRRLDPITTVGGFGISFPLGVRPYLITLQANLFSPFTSALSDCKKGDKETVIDLEGIEERVVEFPVQVRRYMAVYGVTGDKLLLVSEPTDNPTQGFGAQLGEGKNTVEVYDLKERKVEVLLERVGHVHPSTDGRSIVVRTGERVRVVKAGEKPSDSGDTPGRRSGWIELGRFKVSIEPKSEWRQIFREAWQKQKDRFWKTDMSGVDWEDMLRRYEPLLGRVGSRLELTDLIGELQGELATSHAYVYGGDVGGPPPYMQGFLGADITHDTTRDLYVIKRIVRGDSWDKDSSSPLARPGVQIREGDTIVAINGVRVGDGVSPASLLVHQAECDVLITVRSGAKGEDRSYTVRTLRDERSLRYTDWVNARRREVSIASAGRIGYIHIPDMQFHGFVEFHRAFLSEGMKDSLIIDVRYNGGGYVSPLILQRLTQRRLGARVFRWGETVPYPWLTPSGAMVAIANEYAGSDGDLFCDGFKKLGLGKVIGKRTWGGVVGLRSFDPLVDGGVTSQPETAVMTEEGILGRENYGVEPDIEVEYLPSDYHSGRDPQLEVAIREAMSLLDSKISGFKKE